MAEIGGKAFSRSPLRRCRFLFQETVASQAEKQDQQEHEQGSLFLGGEAHGHSGKRN